MILLVYVDFLHFTCKFEIHEKLLNGLTGNTATSETAREPTDWNSNECIRVCRLRDKRGCLVFCLVLVLSVRQPPPDSQISQSRNGF
jgi:hypothetical protein